MKRNHRILLFALGISSFCLLSAFSQKAPKREEFQFAITDREGNEFALYRESFALVIGIDNYTAGWPKLPGVVQDIALVEKALTKHGFKVITIRNPNKEKLLTAIETFISAYGRAPENRLLFYFAGHGHTIKLAYGGDMGYIVPADAPNPNINKDAFLERAIDMRRFDSYARSIECKHALFLFDSCFSGSIFALSRAVPEVISYKTARPVRQFITSGSADEVVPDKSVFSSQFIAGIQGEADQNQDGYVTGTELGEFLQAKVVNYTEGCQHPQYGKIRDELLDKGDFVFILEREIEKQAQKEEEKISHQLELEFWKSISSSTSKEEFEAYLKKFPNGTFVELARARIKAIEKEAAKEDEEIKRELFRRYLREAQDSFNQKNYSRALEAIGSAKKIRDAEELRELEKKVLEKLETASKEKQVAAVKLIYLSPEKVHLYREKLKTLVISDFPAGVSIDGQVNLILTVREDGRISQADIDGSALRVTPAENQGLIENLIAQSIKNVPLDPPLDKNKNSVSLIAWRISYVCNQSDKKLVLTMLDF